MDFPISPSDLPWWGWLLCSLGTGLVAFHASALSEDSSSKGGFGYATGIAVGLILGLISLLCGIIGIVRLVKWIWQD